MRRKARTTPIRQAAKAPAGRRAAKSQKTRKKFDVRLGKQAVSPEKPGKAPQPEITACKRAEEAMRQNEQRMCALLDGALDAVVEIDVQGTITQWNPRAETIFDWTQSEAVGRQLSATIIPPEHREAHARGLRHFLATGDGPILNRRIEITALRRDGTEFPVELTVTAITLGNSRRFTAFIRDITERKRTEEALRASEEFKNRILESSLDCIKVLDLNGHLIFMNGAGQRQMEIRDIQQFCGMPWVEFWKGEYRQAASAAVETAKAGGIAKFVGFCRTASGKEKWWDIYITPMLGLTGTPERLLAISRDITERKQAEQSIREQSRLIETFFKNTLTCIVLLDRDFNFIRVNEAYARACHRDVSDFPGRNHFAFYPSEARKIFEEVRASKVPCQSQAYPFVFPDHPEWGVTYWDWTLVPILGKSGDVELFVFTLNDVTERKRAEEALRVSEQRFRLTIDHANDAIFYLDLNGVIQWANRQAATLIGCSLEKVVGRSFMAALTPEAATLAETRLIAIRRGEFVPPLVEFAILHSDGTMVWAEANSTSVLEDGKVVGRLLVARDVTERKQAEEKHWELYGRLQSSHMVLRTLARRLMEVQEEERRHLAREMHDEIGQALTAAKINVQQALHAPVSPEIGTHLTESVRILDRALQQVRNLALDLRPSLLDDLGLVPTLKWLAERHSRASEIAVQVSAESLDIRPAPEIELACYRVAQEALTNAARHSRASQVRIELARSGRELVLLIRDNGIGFDITTMLSRAAKGESIGLLGMQERVALTGGEMEILSLPGQGTEIRARFPLGGTPQSTEKTS